MKNGPTIHRQRPKVLSRHDDIIGMMVPIRSYRGKERDRVSKSVQEQLSARAEEKRERRRLRRLYV